MKKLLAIVLVLVTVLSLCACGAGEAYTDADKEGFLTADGKTKFTIGIIPNALIMDLNNNSMTKWIEDTCNVDLQFVPFAGGTDVPTQIAAAIAARQELPDICIGVDLDAATLKRYGDEGYIIDLQDYFADKEGATKVFWDRITNELSESDQDTVVRRMTDIDTGAIYTVPAVETSLVDMVQSIAWINVQWLDKLGLEKPTNCEELVNVLRAFKTKDPNGNGMADEIPLYGSTYGLGANVTSWLMNMFTYYNSNRMMMVENGKVTLPYVTDEYREGLKFINELYEEGLLSNMLFGEVEATIATPTNGTALCGIFLGHLSCYAQPNNEVLYQYEPLETWGYGIREPIRISLNNFITENCAEGKRDKAVELLMTLWSWDGSMRLRYGEYGVNWTEPDAGAKSDMGLDATYKLLKDPAGEQNTVRWGAMPTFNAYAECETAQSSDSLTEWQKARIKMHADAYQLFLKAEARNPVDKIPPTLVGTSQEQDDVLMAQTNVSDYRNKAFTDFITGQNGRDITKDSSWKEYIDKIYELGYEDVVAYYQTAYDRLG